MCGNGGAGWRACATQPASSQSANWLPRVRTQVVILKITNAHPHTPAMPPTHAPTHPHAQTTTPHTICATHQDAQAVGQEGPHLARELQALVQEPWGGEGRDPEGMGVCGWMGGVGGVGNGWAPGGRPGVGAAAGAVAATAAHWLHLTARSGTRQRPLPPGPAGPADDLPTAPPHSPTENLHPLSRTPKQKGKQPPHHLLVRVHTKERRTQKTQKARAAHRG